MSTNKKGLVYVISGEGKGKTSAALGMVVRSLAHGRRVVWISWYKDNSWPIGEIRLPEMLSRLQAVTAQQVQDAAREILKDDNLIVAVLEPQALTGKPKRVNEGPIHAR